MSQCAIGRTYRCEIGLSTVSNVFPHCGQHFTRRTVPSDLRRVSVVRSRAVHTGQVMPFGLRAVFAVMRGQPSVVMASCCLTACSTALRHFRHIFLSPSIRIWRTERMTTIGRDEPGNTVPTCPHMASVSCRTPFFFNTSTACHIPAQSYQNAPCLTSSNV